MWAYNQTDKTEYKVLQNNIKLVKEKNELYHSDIYLGKDYSDGIKHYKYIRKYQKNGHTYYVYNDTESKIKDKESELALKTINKIGESGYITKDGHLKKFSTKNGIVYNNSERYTSKKRSSIDSVKEYTANKAADFIMKHKIQKIKDIPRKIHAKGLHYISKALKWLRGD